MSSRILVLEGRKVILGLHPVARTVTIPDGKSAVFVTTCKLLQRVLLYFTCRTCSDITLCTLTVTGAR